MQLFKFFHTENKSNFKTQTAKNGGFFEQLLRENDFEALLVIFCCYEYSASSDQHKDTAQGFPQLWETPLQFFSNPPPAKTDAPP